MAISTLEFSFPRSFLVKVYQKRYSSPLIEYSASYIAPSFEVKQCSVRTINDERLSKHCQLQIPSESETQAKEGKIVLELSKLSVDVSNTEIRIVLHDISDQPQRNELTENDENDDQATIDRINFALPYSCVSKIVKNRGGSIFRSEAWYMGQSGVVLPCMLNTSETISDTGEERLVLVFEGLILSCDISPLTLKFKAGCVDKSKKDIPAPNVSVSLPLMSPSQSSLQGSQCLITPSDQIGLCTVHSTDVSFPLVSDSSAQDVTTTPQINLLSCSVPLVSLSVMTDNSSQPLKTNRESTLESDESYRSLVHIEEIIAKDFSPKDDDSDMTDADKNKENKDESPDLLGKIIEQTIMKGSDTDSENSLERILSVNPFTTTVADAADNILTSAESAGIESKELNKDSDKIDVTDKETSADLQLETEEEHTNQTNKQADTSDTEELGMNKKPQTDNSNTKGRNRKSRSRSKRKRKRDMPSHDQHKEDTSKAKGDEETSSKGDQGTSDSEKVTSTDDQCTVELIDPVSGLMTTVPAEEDEILVENVPVGGKQKNKEKISEDDKSNTGDEQSLQSSDEDLDLSNIIESIKKSLNEEKSPFTVTEAPQQSGFKMPSDLIPPPGMSLGFPLAADTNSSIPADSFNPEWKMRFPWAYHDDENKVIFCRICIMAKKTNIYTSGSHYFCVNPLFTHTYSKDHTDAVATVREQSPDSLKGEGPEWQSMLKQCRKHLRSMKSGRVNSFKYEWLKEFSFLMYDEVEDKMYCKLCQKHDQDSAFLRGTSRFIRKFIQQHGKCKAHFNALSVESEVAENGTDLRFDTEKDIIFGDVETDGSDSEPLRWKRITPEDASSKSSQSTPQKYSYRDLFSNYKDLTSGLRSLTPIKVESHMLPVVVLEDVSQSPNLKSGIFDCKHLKEDGKLGLLKFSSSQTAFLSRHSKSECFLSSKPAVEVESSEEKENEQGNKRKHKKSKERSPEIMSDEDSDSHCLLVEMENVPDSQGSTKRKESMEALVPSKTASMKVNKRNGKKSKEQTPERESDVDSDSHSLLIENEDSENVSDSTERAAKTRKESLKALAPLKTALVKAQTRKGKKSKEKSPERESDVDSASHSLIAENEDSGNTSDSPASTKRSSEAVGESTGDPAVAEMDTVKGNKQKHKKSKVSERESDMDSDSRSLTMENEGNGKVLEKRSSGIDRKLDFSEVDCLDKSAKQSCKQGAMTETHPQTLEKIHVPQKSDYKGLEKIHKAEEILVKFLLNPKEDSRSWSLDAVDVTAWKPVVILKDIGLDTSALHKRVSRKRSASTESEAVNVADEDDSSSVCSSQKRSAISKKELVNGKLRDDKPPRRSSRKRSTSTDSEVVAQGKTKKANQETEDVAVESNKRSSRTLNPRIKPAEDKSETIDQESDAMDLEKDPKPNSRSSLKWKSGRGNKSESKTRISDSENESVDSHDDSSKKARPIEDPKSMKGEKGRSKKLKIESDSESDSDMTDDKVKKSRPNVGHKSSRKKSGDPKSDISSDSDGEPLCKKLTVMVSIDATEMSEFVTRGKSVRGRESRSTKPDSDSDISVEIIDDSTKQSKSTLRRTSVRGQKSGNEHCQAFGEDENDDPVTLKSSRNKKKGKVLSKVDSADESDSREVLDEVGEKSKSPLKRKSSRNTRKHPRTDTDSDSDSSEVVDGGKSESVSKESQEKSSEVDSVKESDTSGLDEDYNKKAGSPAKHKSVGNKKSSKDESGEESDINKVADDPDNGSRDITGSDEKDRSKSSKTQSECDRKEAPKDSVKKHRSGRDKKRGSMSSKPDSDHEHDSGKKSRSTREKETSNKQFKSNADNDNDNFNDLVKVTSTDTKSPVRRRSARDQKNRSKYKADSDDEGDIDEDDSAQKTDPNTKGKSARLTKSGSISSWVDNDDNDSGNKTEMPEKSKTSENKKSRNMHPKAKHLKEKIENNADESEVVGEVTESAGIQKKGSNSSTDDIDDSDSGKATESPAKGSSAEHKKHSNKHLEAESKSISGRKARCARDKERGKGSSEIYIESGDETVSQDQVPETDMKQKSKCRVRKGTKDSKPSDEKSECERDTWKKSKSAEVMLSDVHSDSDNDAVDLVDSMDLTDSDKELTSVQEKHKRKNDFSDESTVKKFKSPGPKSAHKKKMKDRQSKADTDSESDSGGRSDASKKSSSPLGPKSVKIRKLQAMHAESESDIESDVSVISVSDIDNGDDTVSEVKTVSENNMSELLDRLDLTDMMLCHVILHRM